MLCDVWTSRDDPTLRLITIVDAGIPFPLMGETWLFTGPMTVDGVVAEEVGKAGFVTLRSTISLGIGDVIGPLSDHL